MKRKVAMYLEHHLHPLTMVIDLLLAWKRYNGEKKKAFSLGTIPFFNSNLNLNDFAPASKNHTFFILGGSKSINKIESRSWQIIASSLSVGLNNWFIHPFVPNLLMIEGFRKSDVDSPQYHQKVNNLKTYLSHTPVTLLLKDVNSSYLPWELILKSCVCDAYVISKFSVPGRNNENVAKAMKLLSFLRYHKMYPLFSRVSVVLAMSIGYLLGYRNIVLCGIDLNDGHYFWEEPGFVPRAGIALPLSSGQKRKGRHSTVDPEVNIVSADKSILSFTENILNPEGVKVFVSSDSSLLYPSLPLYRFDHVN
jgi:hypothetical protein